VACGQGGGPEPQRAPAAAETLTEPTGTGPQTPTEDSGGPHGGETGVASGGDTAAPLFWDCANLPVLPTSITELVGPAGYHDVLFDQAGYIYGWDSANAIRKVDYAGVGSVFSVGHSSVEQMDWLPDGDIVLGDDLNQVLVRVDATTGATSVLATEVGTVYGVIVGPDGWVYVANLDQVLKVDPATGQKVTVFDPTWTPKVLDWSPDFTKMYVGEIGSGSAKVYVLDLDAAYAPISAPVVLGETNGGWHDALSVDICGNLYLADFNTRWLYRMTPDGVTTALIELVGQQTDKYGHGAEFGSGVGGWRADALYLPQPYDGSTVREVVIGVPSRRYVP